MYGEERACTSRIDMPRNAYTYEQIIEEIHNYLGMIEEKIVPITSPYPDEGLKETVSPTRQVEQLVGLLRRVKGICNSINL